MAENWVGKYKNQNAIIASFGKWQAKFVQIVAERDKRVNDRPSFEKDYYDMGANVLAELTSTIDKLKVTHQKIEASIPQGSIFVNAISGGGGELIYADKLADKYKELVNRFNNLDGKLPRRGKVIPPQKFKQPRKAPKKPIPKLRDR